LNDFQIVGIMLIRNEDVHIERAIRNVVDFCDKIIVADHQSRDRTFEICRGLAREYPKIDLRSIQHLFESFQALAPYYGTDTWIFAVDGDEIFDPIGLREMRVRLLSGGFSQDWNIFANTLNCIRLDMQAKKAWGYLAPPSRAGARLFNFSIIEDWPGATGERLHGEGIVFKNGFHAGLRCYLHQELEWEHSCFRYVHASFLQRSSLDARSRVKTRLNPDELLRIENTPNWLKKMLITLQIQLVQMFGRDWKNRKYKHGLLVEKDVSAFFRDEYEQEDQNG